VLSSDDFIEGGKMKTIRMIAISAVVLSIAILGWQWVAAQGPDGMDPLAIPHVDNLPHPLTANASAWYRFGYGNGADTGDRPTATVRLINGNHTGVGFEVWPPEIVNNTKDNKPIGRGTPTIIDCDSGYASSSGQCQTKDLTWTGAFGASGNYFVRVINTNNFPVTFWLTVQGQTVSQPTPTRVPTSTATPTTVPKPTVAATPTGTIIPPLVVTQTVIVTETVYVTRTIILPPLTPVTPAPEPVAAPPPPTIVPPSNEPPVVANADDPNRAMYMDNQQHRLAANSAMWFRFDYSADDASSRLTALVRLVNGNNSGVRFEVWTPNLLFEWWKKSPVGRGTASSANDADLVWRGGLTGGGTYYVRVINDYSITTTFLLVVE
jgi:hypothetical protein